MITLLAYGCSYSYAAIVATWHMARYIATQLAMQTLIDIQLQLSLSLSSPSHSRNCQYPWILQQAAGRQYMSQSPCQVPYSYHDSFGGNCKFTPFEHLTKILVNEQISRIANYVSILIWMALVSQITCSCHYAKLSPHQTFLL